MGPRVWRATDWRRWRKETRGVKFSTGPESGQGEMVGEVREKKEGERRRKKKKKGK